MANTILTPQMITKEGLRVLENSLTLTLTANRKYSNEFAQSGAKIGDTLNIRKPPRYIVSEGQALDLQDSTETRTSLVLNKQFHVDFQFSSKELTLDINDYSRQFVKPAMAALANKIDVYVASFYTEIYQASGTPGSVPSTSDVYLDAGVELDDAAVPRDGNRSVVISPRMQARIVSALQGLFQASGKIAEQYTSGQMGTALGFDWHMDQNTATHRYGTYAGTPLVNGADQTGTSLITDGWSSGASTLNRGDLFTIAGVYMVNAQSRLSVGKLQKFVVTTTTSDTTGAMTIPIQPEIIISGQFQTVDSSPANDAAITVLGATGVISPQGIAWHKDAFTLASADLEMPNGVDMAARASSNQLGISIRMVRDFNIDNDQFPARMDVLVGGKLVRPEMAARVQS